MAFVAAAIGTGILGGGASIGGAFIQAGATRDAAGQQAAAARYAADLQKQMYEEQRSDLAPWRAAGGQALSDMQNPYFQQNFSMKDFQEDPGYQFNMQQGMNALQNSAAARGGLMSGNTGEALAKYSQGMASNEYQNAYNRFTNNQTNRFNRLSSLAGIGQTANAQLGQAGQNYANTAGGYAVGAGNAGAAATIAQGNIWGGTLSSLGNNMGNNWMQASMMNRFMPQNSGSTMGSANDYFGGLSGGGNIEDMTPMGGVGSNTSGGLNAMPGE